MVADVENTSFTLSNIEDVFFVATFVIVSYVRYVCLTGYYIICAGP